MTDYDQLLDLSMWIAYGFVYTGAETFRAEDSATRVLRAYGAENIEVMVMANFATILFSKDGKKYHGQKRIPASNNSMKRVEELNNITRHIVEERPDIASVSTNVLEIIQAPGYSKAKELLITGFIGFSFALLLGGTYTAALCSFVIDVLARLALEPLYKYKTNRLFINMAGGLLVTLLTGPANFIGLGTQQSIIASASFMFLFPGVSLVNSIRDLIASDYLAGVTKLMETLLVAVGIAVGSGIGLSIMARFM